MFLTRLFSSYFLLASCFCHFLCCGVPLSLSILSLSTNAGLPYLLFSNISLESFEPVFLIISTLLLLILVLSEILMRYIESSQLLFSLVIILPILIYFLIFNFLISKVSYG